MKIKLLILLLFPILLTSCEKLFEKEEPPTKSNMEGVWEVTSVRNNSNEEIINQLKFPILAFHLSSDGTIISTAGPLTMFVVYGQSEFAKIASQIDQAFNYASLDFNGGEFFVGGGVQENFTLEMKLEGLPGQKALTDLLEIIGIGNDYLDIVVYHKFMNIGISFEDEYETMIWTIDSQTTAAYNTKDDFGNYVMWYGWPINNFQGCQIILSKRAKDLKEIVQEAI